MTVRVLLFARLREACGADSLQLELPERSTAADCFARLAERHGRLGSRSNLMVAVNASYVDWSARLAPGDEVAFIPPVSGG